MEHTESGASTRGGAPRRMAAVAADDARTGGMASGAFGLALAFEKAPALAFG